MKITSNSTNHVPDTILGTFHTSVHSVLKVVLSFRYYPHIIDVENEA